MGESLRLMEWVVHVGELLWCLSGHGGGSRFLVALFVAKKYKCDSATGGGSGLVDPSRLMKWLVHARVRFYCSILVFLRKE